MCLIITSPAMMKAVPEPLALRLADRAGQLVGPGDDQQQAEQHHDHAQ
jgi:hypothetical protein